MARPSRADYTTLAAVRRQFAFGSTETGDDSLLQGFIHSASKTGTSLAQGRVFMAYRDTRLYDAYGRHISPRALNLNGDLLSLTTLTNGDSTVVSANDYVLRTSGVDPKWRIEFTSGGGITWTYTNSYQDAISVAGIWGYHENYSEAWGDTLENVPDGGMTSSATSFTSADADAVDDRGYPRYEVLQYLKIDNEFIQITAVNTITNVVTIRRGVLGTTAASHLAGVDIYSYRQLPDIEQAVIDLVVYLYKNRDNTGESIRVLEGGQVITNVALRKIADTFKDYRRSEIRVLK